MTACRIAILLIAILCLSGRSVWSFHEEGVANCGGCHIMHVSEDGSAPDVPAGAGMLLKSNYVSDICLDCHASNWGRVLGSNPLGPPPEMGGGNFVFLLEDNINDGADGAISPIQGHAAGHNVISSAYGIDPDPINSSSQGGNYPSNALSCTSCHDPHGNNSFRILRGQGTERSTGFVFRYPAPEAVGIDLLVGSETRTNHTAYKSGWSMWCANCHGLYHQSGGSQVFDHPSNRNLGGNERDSYNSYNGVGDPTGGTFETAYITALPIEDPGITVSSTSGASSTSRLSCMSCHRAHATSAPKSTRWDPNVAFLGSDGMASSSYAIPNPYVEPTQRPLCVKCHYQESTEHGQGRACMDCHRDLGG